MKDNANQDIRTGYGVNDVFVPNAANQLARTNHYDFVITQEMVDNYVAQHGSATALDVGALIASNADGTDGTWTLAECVAAPVSIYIAADLSRDSALPLIFTQRLVWTGSTYNSQVVDGRTFFPSGSASRSATDGMVNVYTQYGFKVSNLAGGFNFWTAPQAPITVLGTSGWDGVVRLGAYGTDSTGIDLAGRTGLHIICEQLVAGAGIDSTVQQGAITSAYDFPVVYADWMHGAEGSTVSYAVPASAKPGLFQQIQQSVALGTDPVLTEYGEAGEVTRYRLESISKSAGALAPDRIIYSCGGKTLEIAADGTVTRKASTQGEPIVITDFDCYMNGSGATQLTPKQSLFIDGTFVTDSDELGKLYTQPGAGTAEENGLFLGNHAKVKWVTWSQETESGGTEHVNSNTTLFVRTDSLVEGLVYEIEIVITSCMTHTPSASEAMLSQRPSGPPFGVSFAGPDNNWATVVPYRWGGTSSSQASHASLSKVMFNFERDSAVDTSEDFVYGREGGTLMRLATAKLTFVKLNGSLHALVY